MGKFNTGERRGMLVITGILLIIVGGLFLTRYASHNNTSQQVHELDSVAHELQLQAAQEKESATKNNTPKQKKKKKNSSKSSKKYIERNPLNESLPQHN